MIEAGASRPYPPGQLAEAPPQVVYVFDLETGRLAYLTRWIENLLGHPMRRLLELSRPRLLRLVHPDDRRRYRQHLADALTMADGEVRTVDLRLRTADGSWRCCQLTESALERDRDGRLRRLVGTLQDWTQPARRQEEPTAGERSKDALESRVDQLEMLSQMTEAVVQAEALDELCSHALRGLERMLGADAAALLMQEEDRELKLQACWGLSEEYLEMATQYSPWAPTETAAEVVVLSDLSAPEAQQRLGKLGKQLRADGLKAALFLPLVARGQLFGRCSLFYRRRQGFEAEELRLAQGVVSHLALAAERKRHEQMLIHAALHDGLTDLPNRVLFRDRLELALRRSRRSTYPGFAVLFVDLDNFKLVNDSLGHHRGDELLVAIARRLADTVRPGDTVARQGGDEFTILLDEVEEVAHVLRVVERIQKRLAAPFAVGGTEVFTTASIGITASHSRYQSPDEVLRDADTAMYQAKRQGRGRHALFNPEMHASAVAQLQLELDLRRALQRQEFVLHYQPIWEIASGEIVDFEALLRWQHPQRGLLSPDSFLAEAVDTGLIIAISEWAVREAGLQLAAWRHRLPVGNELGVSVNLGVRELGRPDLVDRVAEVLAETALPRGSLRLEITEDSVIDRPDQTLDVLARLRDLGVRIHLDDFGTGYSSLSYLHRLPIDALKIDRSFTARTAENDREEAILRAILFLGHHLGYVIIAEGVETAAQLAHLREKGCDRAQGFLLSPPLDAPEAEALLLDRLASRPGLAGLRR